MTRLRWFCPIGLACSCIMLSLVVGRAADAGDGNPTHLLTWKDYDGIKDPPEKARYFLDDKYIGTGNEGFEAFKREPFPRGSDVLIRPPWVLGPSGNPRPFPFELADLVVFMRERGVRVLWWQNVRIESKEEIEKEEERFKKDTTSFRQKPLDPEAQTKGFDRTGEYARLLKSNFPMDATPQQLESLLGKPDAILQDFRPRRDFDIQYIYDLKSNPRSKEHAYYNFKDGKLSRVYTPLFGGRP